MQQKGKGCYPGTEDFRLLDQKSDENPRMCIIQISHQNVRMREFSSLFFGQAT
jgi:hypothetical protein